MLGSINPLGERGRSSRFAVTFTAYLAGSLAGGAALGGVLGLAGNGARVLVSVGTTANAVVVVAVCAVVLALDLGAFGLRIPTVRRQVNKDMLDEYRGWVYGLSFGVQLGLGVVTIVTSATVYAAFALAFLTGSWQAGLLVGAAYGLMRAAPLLLVARVRDPYNLRRLFARIDGWARRAQYGTVGLLTLVSVAAVAAMWKSSSLG